MMKNNKYYQIQDDVNAYPDATIYIVWSRRGVGKTYSALKYPYEQGFKTVYMKRTNEDVKTICAYNSEAEFDPSPFAPINRDLGINIKPHLIQQGIGGFYRTNDEGKCTGAAVSYICSLNAMKKVKGIDLSEAQWIIFDEFIPQPGEIVKRAEGEMLLSLFETVNRDRRKRGKPGLKLMLFANAEEISTPITNTLEVIDTMAEMQAKGIDTYYDRNRGILLHHVSNEDVPLLKEEMGDMYRVMKGTAWADKSYGGYFSGNDFSNICEVSLKGYRCLIELQFNRKTAYIYVNQRGMYYMTDTKGKCIRKYNLDRENEQKRFYIDYGSRLRDACVEDRFKFRKYSYYDLIINYKSFYDI